VNLILTTWKREKRTSGQGQSPAYVELGESLEEKQNCQSWGEKRVPMKQGLDYEEGEKLI